MKHEITTKDGTHIYYRDWARDSPWCSATAGHFPQMRSRTRCSSWLSHGYRCIAHDRRGHGRSSQPWNGNDMDTYADDLARWSTRSTSKTRGSRRPFHRWR